MARADAGRGWGRRRRPALVGRHPLLDGPPTRKPRSGGVVALLAVLAVVLLVWVVSGGDPGTATGTDDRYVDLGTATSTPVPTTTPTAGPGPTDPASGLPVVALTGLPPAAQATVAQVTGGGSLPEETRPTGFADDAGVLPAAPAGYYRAYAPPTSGRAEPGPQTLVVGGRGELYWTEDDGVSFVAVRP